MIARLLLLACLAACSTASSSDQGSGSSATNGSNDVTNKGPGITPGGGETGKVKLSLKAK